MHQKQKVQDAVCKQGYALLRGAALFEILPQIFGRDPEEHSQSFKLLQFSAYFHLSVGGANTNEDALDSIKRAQVKDFARIALSGTDDEQRKLTEMLPVFVAWHSKLANLGRDGIMTMHKRARGDKAIMSDLLMELQSRPDTSEIDAVAARMGFQHAPILALFQKWASANYDRPGGDKNRVNDYKRRTGIMGRFFVKLRDLGSRSELREIMKALSREPRPEEAHLRVELCERALQLVTRNEDPRKWAMLKREQAIQLIESHHGSRADNLEHAIAALKAALEVRTPEKMPDEWARTRSNLANAYIDRVEGVRADNIELAIEGFREVLKVRTRDTKPNEWAGTQMDLASAFLERIYGNRSENQERAIKGYRRAIGVWGETGTRLDLATAQLNLANTFCERIAGPRIKNIEAAIAAYEKALQSCESIEAPVLRASIQVHLSQALTNRGHGVQEENLESALILCHEALQSLRPTERPKAWAHASSTLGNIYMERIRGDRAQNIELAIEAHSNALNVLPPLTMPKDWAGVQDNLANAFGERVLGDRSDNIEQAIQGHLKALAVWRRLSLPRRTALCLKNLSEKYLHRLRGDHAANIEKAVEYCEEAADMLAYMEDADNWASCLMSLGNVYMERHRGGLLENINRAIDAYRAALAVWNETEKPSEWALVQMNLATAYQEGSVRDNTGKLKLSIQASEAALRVHTRERSPQLWASTLNNLANALKDSPAEDDVEKAIQAYESLLKVWTRESMPLQWALTQENLADAYAKRTQGNPEENIREAISKLRAALGALPEGVALASSAKMLHSLGTLLMKTENWAEAIPTLEQVISARDRLYEVATSEDARQAILFRFGAAAPRLVHALTRPGACCNPRGAVIVAENARARALSERITHDIAPLANATREDGVAFERVRDRIAGLEAQVRRAVGNLERPSYLKILDELRNAHNERKAIVNRIQRYDPSFLADRGWDSIQECSSFAPLVYLVATPTGGVALIVSSNADVSCIELPDLTLAELTDQTTTFLRGINGPTMPERYASLDRLLRWLWDSIMEDVTMALKSESEATLLPSGLLGMLPLHAAWRPCHTESGRRVYVLDELSIRFAPNARVLLASAQSASTAVTDGVLAVGEPQSTNAEPLYSAAEEIENVVRWFEKYEILCGTEATCKRVLQEAPNFPVLHLTCHGKAHPSKPLESCLLMAGGERLTLRDFLDSDLKTTRLAILSACETAIPGVELPDEMHSLPAGLMQAGVDGVLATQWSILDESTMILMCRFYQFWRGEGLLPHQALAASQKWMRDSTGVEMLDFYRRYRSKIQIRNLSPLEEKASSIGKIDDPEAHSFQHPYHWAGFCYTGA